MAGVKRGIASRNGKASPMLLSALNSKITETMKIISLPNFDVVRNKLKDIAHSNPVLFPDGFNDIHAVSNPDMFAGFDTQNRIIYVSSAESLVKGFSPAKELISAIHNIQQKIPLTFNNEYAIETVWHEIWHGRTHKSNIPIGKDRLTLESLVQFVSRHSYNEMMAILDYKAQHQEKIINIGYAYQQEVSNLRALLKEININEAMMASNISDLLIANEDGGALIDAVINDLSRHSGVDKGKIKRALKFLASKNGFSEKIRNLLSY